MGYEISRKRDRRQEGLRKEGTMKQRKQIGGEEV